MEANAKKCAIEGQLMRVESFCGFLNEICNLMRGFGKLTYFAFSGKFIVPR